MPCAVFALEVFAQYSSAYEQYYVGNGTDGMVCPDTGTIYSLAQDSSHKYTAFNVSQAAEVPKWAVDVTASSTLASLVQLRVAPDWPDDSATGAVHA